jgi:hypothetical protein
MIIKTRTIQNHSCNNLPEMVIFPVRFPMTVRSPDIWLLTAPMTVLGVFEAMPDDSVKLENNF